MAWYPRFMRIVFMGAPAFAVPTLRAIIREGHAIAGVYTRAAKPGGRRGLSVKKTSVHEVADSLGLPVYAPRTLRSSAVQETFRAHAADVCVVIAYGLLVPKEILEAPKYGCVNLHASLLPRWRGAAPIQRAIMAGDSKTGVDLIRMGEALDTGPIGLREVVPIRPQDTAGDLSARLAEVAAGLAVEGLRKMKQGTLIFHSQDPAGATYARKIEKQEAEVDWRIDSETVKNQVHGLSPAPGAFSYIVLHDRTERLKLLRAEAVFGCGVPGTILNDEMTVACGRGAIRVIEAQRAGSIVLSGREFMRRERLSPGAVFAAAHANSSGFLEAP